MDEALPVGVFETDLAEVASHGLQRKSRKSPWEKELGIHMESPVVVWGLMAGHALRIVEFLVDTSLVEDVHQVQRPYSAYQGRQHELERRLELVRIQE